MIREDTSTERVALITGAGSGIGLTIAKIFARRGMAVVIADMNKQSGESAADAIRAEGHMATFVEVDLKEESGIKKMIDSAVTEYGHLDVLINNARPALRHGTYEQTLEEWDLAMNVLLKAPAFAARYAMPYLEKASTPSIVNIASTNAFFISQQPVTYHIAKAGLLHLTRFLAYECGNKKIRVNAICPGLINKSIQATEEARDHSHKCQADIVVPLNRFGMPEEVADLAWFLCSTSAAYLTGQVITLDGGMTLGDQFMISQRLNKSILMAKGLDLTAPSNISSTQTISAR